MLRNFLKIYESLDCEISNEFTAYLEKNPLTMIPLEN